MASASSTAAPERARWPRLAAAPHPLLRSLLPRGYGGFTEATTPRHLLLPATSSVPLVVKLVDLPNRPQAFVMGAHDSFMVLEGACARSYLEVWLAPLGAYRLLGLPMDELSGQTVDLVGVFGADGRRLVEQLRETSSWGRRFAVMDRFLLGRLEVGPRPSPEVGRAWERLVTSAGTVPIGQIASEVGWSHKHLIARFRQQVGVRPKTAARLLRFDGVWRRLDERRPLDWGLVANEAGYADQAHLVRDFHQFTGPPRPPSRPGSWSPPPPSLGLPVPLGVGEWMTLDGVMPAPGAADEDTTGGFKHGGWHLPYFDDLFRDWVVEGYAKAGGFLFGRRTYESLAAYWPNASEEEQPVAEPLNTKPNYVASRTLTGLVDELRVMIDPLLVGGGKRIFRDDGARRPLRLVEGKGDDHRRNSRDVRSRRELSASLAAVYGNGDRHRRARVCDGSANAPSH